MSSIETTRIEENGKTYIVPVKKWGGFTLKDRVSMWVKWQQLGLPLPDPKTGRVKLVKREGE